MDSNVSKSVFTIKSIIGRNPNVPILNLTTDSQKTTYGYAAGHLAAIYNGHTKTTEYYQYHTNEIFQLLCNQDGRFFVTVDTDCCAIWDRHHQIDAAASTPIRSLRLSLKSSEKLYPIVYAAISQDAKYLIIASTNQLDFWIWSTFRERPHATYEFPTAPRRLNSIRFNPSQTDTFACTLEKSMIFGQWKNGQLDVHEVSADDGNPVLLDSCFMDNSTDSSTCYSVTQKCGIVWSNKTEAKKKFSIKNMYFYKILPIHSKILTISSADRILMITMEDGWIRFYGPEFQILYWTDSLSTEMLVSSSFDLCTRKYRFIDLLHHDEQHFTCTGHVGTDGIETYFKETVLTDATHRPFMIRKFLATTKTGKIIEYDLVRNQLRPHQFAASSEVNTFDLHPKLTVVCAGCEDGRIFLYDYAACKLIVERNIAEYPRDSVLLMQDDEEPHQESSSTSTIMNDEVTAMSFTSNGQHLLCAVGKGFLFMLSSTTLELINRKPLRFSLQPIKDLIFSSDNMLMACYDTEMIVYLCHFQQNSHWRLVGKYLSHVLPIVYLAFSNEDMQLVCGSEDRHRSVFDVQKSIESGATALHLVGHFRSEQSSQIMCGIPFGDDCVLSTSSTLKYRILHVQQMYTVKTIIGHSGGSPIKNIMLFGDSDAVTCDGQSFLVFSTVSKSMGIQLLPLDGNPFKAEGKCATTDGISLRLNLR